MTIAERRKWWKEGVVYQVYPASFKDSNGDGIGDIQGIISELDYIQSIGVDIIWICPMYDSPQIDMGYDIRNYEAVYAPYGTVKDMEDLIAEAHRRGLRIILDLVVNHTSDEHAWFQESRKSKGNPKRDWYIWRPAKYVDGVRKPPNNWRSNFGGSAWQWDEATEEYYLHLFCPEQPDLNWENEETRQAIYKSAMTFWLDRGCDGFRVDTVNMYSKPGDLPDAPITEEGVEEQFAGYQYCNGPRMHEYLSEMNEILKRYDAMSVGECPNTHDPAHVLRYVGASQRQLDMVFQFDAVDIGMGPYKFQTTPFNFKLPALKDAFAGMQSLIRGTDGWTTVFLENHDQARSISRFGSDAPEHRIATGKMLALMLMAMSGTLFIYQGQELGMVNFPLEWDVEEYKDVDSLNYYNMVKKRSQSDPVQLAAAKAGIQHLARDHARVPMQWDSSANAGFSTAKPWMRVNDDYKSCNAKQQSVDKSSVLAFWKQMLTLRREHADLFIYGDFDLVDRDNENLFTFTKQWHTDKAFVVGNFSGEPQEFEIPGKATPLQLLAGTVPGADGLTLQPYEARIYLL